MIIFLMYLGFMLLPMIFLIIAVSKLAAANRKLEQVQRMQAQPRMPVVPMAPVVPTTTVCPHCGYQYEGAFCPMCGKTANR